ncbi:hypothetical protein FACS189494_08280 [Spirochaetia bacterium]|nr:hypothetical protein FACS189494_08280 [Spirochaetia bacterium]
MRLIVLIPHRDSLIEYKKYCRALFSAGVQAALSFPVVAPIAIVSRAWKPQELKNAAAQIRAANTAKWTTGDFAEIAAPICNSFTPPQGFSFSGVALNDVNINLDNDSVIFKFKKLLLCAAVQMEEKPTTNSSLITPPVVTFRAAAVANMIVHQIDKADNIGMSCKIEDSFEWKTGRLFWLPK